MPAGEPEPSAKGARPFRVGGERVLFDPDRVLDLDELRRDVGDVGNRPALCVDAVVCRRRAGGNLAASLDLHPGLARVPLLAVAGHGEVAVGAAGTGGHLVGQHLREGAEDGVRDPEAAEEPGRDRRGGPWIDVRPLRSGHRDGPEISARVGDLPPEDGPRHRIDHGLGRIEGIVDRALHLRGSAGEVDPDLVVLLDEIGDDGDGPAAESVVVDVVGKRPGSVGELPDPHPGEGLGVVEDLALELEEPLGAMAAGEPQQLVLGEPERGNLAAHVAQHLVRNPHRLLDDAKERAVGLAPLVELERRNAQPLLVDLRAVARVAPRHPTPDIGVMTHCTGIGDERPVREDGLEHEDVGEVAAPFVGVVVDEDVAGKDPALVVFDAGLQRGRHSPHVNRLAEALADELSVGTEEPGREVVAEPHDGRARGADQSDRHRIRDAGKGVVDDLELRRIAGTEAGGRAGAGHVRSSGGARPASVGCRTDGPGAVPAPAARAAPVRWARPERRAFAARSASVAFRSTARPDSSMTTP